MLLVSVCHRVCVFVVVGLCSVVLWYVCVVVCVCLVLFISVCCCGMVCLLLLVVDWCLLVAAAPCVCL